MLSLHTGYVFHYHNHIGLQWWNIEESVFSYAGHIEVAGLVLLDEDMQLVLCVRALAIVFVLLVDNVF